MSNLIGFGPIGRRTLLGGLATTFLAACGGPDPAKAPHSGPQHPPTVVELLPDLVLAAHLRWMFVVRPRDIAATPSLIPAVGEMIPEANFDAFQAATKIDLRQIKSAVVASFDDGAEGSLLYLVRSNADPRLVERKFRERLVADEKRAVDCPDLIRLSGKAGTRSRTFAAIGADVVAYQEDGDPERGPVRIATLLAQGKLTKSPRALEREPLRSMFARFGDAPAIAVAPGPFEGEWAAAAGGLLGVSDAVGIAFRPSARDALWLSIALSGAFSKDAEAASERLALAWAALADSSFGNLLGLHEPVQPALPTHTDQVIAIAVELDPLKLARGIAAATKDDIDSIMRW